MLQVVSRVKLEAIKYDDACDLNKQFAVANKVVNDGVKYVISHLCSDALCHRQMFMKTEAF